MKITMYELLGMVKDGKIPKKIKYDNDIWEYIEEKENYKKSNGASLNWDYVALYCLKEPVEILEEKKIPDEININLAYIDKEYLLDKEDVDRKINEIINRHNILVDKVSDYLKSKGE